MLIKRRGSKTQLFLTCLLVGASFLVTSLNFTTPAIKAQAQEPGTVSGGKALALSAGALSPVVTQTGLINYSIDGLGTLNAAGNIRVQKPAGATARNAYLMSATVPGFGTTISNGDITINGIGVTFTQSVANFGGLTNYFGDVTSIVKPIVDAAAAGIVNLTISEGTKSLGIDGEILVVIFDDPAQTMTNTFLLLFGAQDTTGDTLNVTTSPLNPANAIDLSLGISFGFQGFNQASIVKVNNTLLTSIAGGQDDGTDNNGALLTVGGIGDSSANPANPSADPNNNPRQDDELYNLAPFVTAGATSLSVFTQNPSNDDNILFAGFFFRGATATVPGAFDFCLQDDSSGSIFQFNSTTGDYVFNNCQGVVIGGTGVVTKKGSTYTLQDSEANRRVLATLDNGVRRGKASIESSSLGRTFTLIDRNTANNICVCPP